MSRTIEGAYGTEYMVRFAWNAEWRVLRATYREHRFSPRAVTSIPSNCPLPRGLRERLLPFPWLTYCQTARIFARLHHPLYFLHKSFFCLSTCSSRSTSSQFNLLLPRSLAGASPVGTPCSVQIQLHSRSMKRAIVPKIIITHLRVGLMSWEKHRVYTYTLIESCGCEVLSSC